MELPFVIYKYLQYRLQEASARDKTLTWKEACGVIGKIIQNVPANLRPIILKEMEFMNLIKRCAKRKIKIAYIAENPAKSINGYYDYFGLYD